MTRIRAILVALALFLVLLPSPAIAQKASQRCEDYATQEDAQAAFDSNPERYRELDDDGDGIACEHLPAESNTDDSSLFPWVAGGVLIAGAAGGIMLAMRRMTRKEAPAEKPVTANHHPEYDPELELELELIKAEQDHTNDGEEYPRA